MEFKIPTETVELPSKGLLYPESHPLKSGTVEMKYMTAKEEDILTNQNYIKDGTVIDRLFKSLLITDFNYDDLLIGDKNAIMVAARILSYGKDYEFQYNGEKQVVDLAKLEHKVNHPDFEAANSNEFSFTLPSSGNLVTFKLLTHAEEIKIDQEIKGLQRINKKDSSEVTTRLKHLITGVNGSTDRADIHKFVSEYLLAKDARALREYYSQITPDIELKFNFIDEDGADQEAVLPIGIDFFWPDA